MCWIYKINYFAPSLIHFPNFYMLRVLCIWMYIYLWYMDICIEVFTCAWLINIPLWLCVCVCRYRCIERHVCTYTHICTTIVKYTHTSLYCKQIHIYIYPHLLYIYLCKDIYLIIEMSGELGPSNHIVIAHCSL